MKTQLTEDFKGMPLFQNNKWSIEVCTIPRNGKRTLVVVRDKTFTDFVMIYDDKRIAFDHPESIPAYIIEKVRKYAQTI